MHATTTEVRQRKLKQRHQSYRMARHLCVHIVGAETIGHPRQPAKRTICRRRDDVHDECRRSTSSSTPLTPDRRPQHRLDDHERDRTVILIAPLVQQQQRTTRSTTGDADGTYHARGVRRWDTLSRYRTALLRKKSELRTVKTVTIRNIALVQRQSASLCTWTGGSSVMNGSALVEYWHDAAQLKRLVERRGCFVGTVTSG